MKNISNKNFRIYIECDDMGCERDICVSVAAQLRDIAEVLLIHGKPEKMRDIYNHRNGERIGTFYLSVNGADHSIQPSSGTKSGKPKDEH